jgi:hypothetical protein
MISRRIFLDLDDVLNSMTLPIMGQIFDCNISPYAYDYFPWEVGYDIIAAVAQYKRMPKLTPQEFWETVPGSFWATVPKSRECDDLVHTAGCLVGHENVFIATTPTKDPEAHGAKVEWIKANLPEWIHRQYFITPRKWILAQPGAILIDDHAENCSRFEYEGGKSILFPRPWNPLHCLSGGSEPMNYVRNQLNTLFGG